MNWLANMLSKSGHAPPTTSWAKIVEASNSRSGFTRERAVMAVARSGRPEAIAILLKRANDWVYEVRRAAKVGLELLLSTVNLQAWAAALEEVAALERGGREDHSQLLERIRLFLSADQRLAIVRAANSKPSRGAARLLFAWELRAQSDPQARVLLREAALDSGDIGQAFLAVHAAAGLPTQEVERVGLRACGAPFAAIRAQGLRLLEGAGLRPPSQLLVSLGLDASPLVRSMALARITDTTHELEAAARAALAALQGTKGRAVALDVLCTLKVADAGELMERACADPAALVRCAGFAGKFSTAAANGDGASVDRLVQQVLGDPSARVRRLAAERVRRGAQAPGHDALLQLIARNPRAFPQLAAVAERLSPWDRLTFLLHAQRSVAAESGTGAQVGPGLLRWADDMRRTFVQPSAGQTVELARSWAAVRDDLPSHVQRAVAEHLRAQGIVG